MKYTILPTNKDLLHHGVKGQKWGVKNGPPYPIQRVNKKEIYKKSKEKNPKIDYKHTEHNLNKWG